MAKNIVWKLFYAPTQITIDEMTTDQAVEYVANIPVSHRDFWYAWTPGFPKWLRVTKIKTLNPPGNEISHSTSCYALPPVFPAPVAAGNVSVELQEPKEETPAASDKGKERRRHARYRLKINVTIEMGLSKFKSFTKDVSYGGIQLDRPLPFTPRMDKCRITMKYSGAATPVNFTARILQDAKNPKRIQFTGGPESDQKRFRLWLDVVTKGRAAA